MLLKALSTIAILAVTFIGLVIFLFSPDPYWFLAMVIIVLAWIIYFLFFIPYKPTATRARWAFWACFTIITAVLTTYFVLRLLAHPITYTISPETFSFIDFIEIKQKTIPVNPRISSLVLGSIIGFFFTSVLFLILGYLSSFYVMALHEDMKFWDALKSFFFLLFNKQLAWLIVEDGKVKEIKKQGFTNKWLSRGKIIVKAGNAIVTEKGAKITGIHGPGVVVTTKDEMIRQVFDLRPQNFTHTLEDVITHDKIPLKIVFGVGYRITPAANPNLPNVLKEKSLGVYPVEKQTLHKATFNSGSGGWEGFGKHVAVGQLRDHIMSHRIDEIFEIENYYDDVSIRVNERQVKKIENAIKAAVNAFDDKNLGVTITSIDIKEIHFPSKLKNAIIESISADKRAYGQANAIESIGMAKTEQIALMLDRILTLITDELPFADAETVRQFILILTSVYQRALTDDVLVKDSLEANLDAMKKLAESEGPKFLSTGSLLETSNLLTSQLKSNGK